MSIRLLRNENDEPSIRVVSTTSIALASPYPHQFVLPHSGFPVIFPSCPIFSASHAVCSIWCTVYLYLFGSRARIRQYTFSSTNCQQFVFCTWASAFILYCTVDVWDCSLTTNNKQYPCERQNSVNTSILVTIKATEAAYHRILPVFVELQTHQ